MDIYQPNQKRYNSMLYRRCGKSGILLPVLSLGLWHNFGDMDNAENYTKIIHTAFDNGITHFDLANNYGPPPGAAEKNFGHILRKSLAPYRDEILISTKAGHDMWEGPYGSWGSRKHLMASIDQSLKRLGTEYVDIFYSHRPDPETPIEETIDTLLDIVKQGKALYIGISKYNKEQTLQVIEYLKQQSKTCLIHQDRYSMLERHVEEGLLDITEANGMGFIAFSPLAQGLLTNRYINGIPQNSRAARESGFLKKEQITPQLIEKIKKLNSLAQSRKQTLAEMALAWLLKDKRVSSVIIGASSVEQLRSNLKAIENTIFTEEELSAIDSILNT